MEEIYYQTHVHVTRWQHETLVVVNRHSNPPQMGPALKKSSAQEKNPVFYEKGQPDMR